MSDEQVSRANVNEKIRISQKDLQSLVHIMKKENLTLPRFVESKRRIGKKRLNYRTSLRKTMAEYGEGWIVRGRGCYVIERHDHPAPEES